jgi:hypothetical protein
MEGWKDGKDGKDGKDSRNVLELVEGAVLKSHP